MLEKNSSRTNYIILIVINVGLAIAGWVYLNRSASSASAKTVDPSDYIAVAAILVSLLIGLVAVIYSSKSLQFAQKAEEGQLYIKMMERYTSPEMVEALQTLSSFRTENFSVDEEDKFKNAINKWQKDLKSGDVDAEEVNVARHRVKYFYRDLMQLVQANYFSKTLAKRICNTGGRHLFMHIVLPMDIVMNEFKYRGEYDPFHEIYAELNEEQNSDNEKEKSLPDTGKV